MHKQFEHMCSQYVLFYPFYGKNRNNGSSKSCKNWLHAEHQFHTSIYFLLLLKAAAATTFHEALRATVTGYKWDTVPLIKQFMNRMVDIWKKLTRHVADANAHKF